MVAVSSKEINIESQRTPSQVPAVHYKPSFQEWRRRRMRSWWQSISKGSYPQFWMTVSTGRLKSSCQSMTPWNMTDTTKDWGLSRQGLQDYSFDNIHVTWRFISWLICAACRLVQDIKSWHQPYFSVRRCFLFLKHTWNMSYTCLKLPEQKW